jgi:AraC-like DNA-binding protein
MLLVDSLIIAGVANGALLALASALAARRDRRWAWLSAMCALMVISLTAIMVSHRSAGMIERLALAVEQLGWLAGPTLYSYVRISLGYGLQARRTLAHFTAPGLVLLIAAAVILTTGIEPLPIELLVTYQAAYTALSLVLFVRRPQPADRTAVGYWQPVTVLSVMIALHAAQLARMTAWGALNADVVPLIGGAAMMAMMFVGLVLAQQPAAPTGERYVKSALPKDRAEEIFETARAALGEERLYRRFDLTLGDVAARLGVGVHHLSQALSVAGRTSFNGMVADMRVEDAKQRLLDPVNAGVAVEPLGMESGFRSRSAFYAAFRERTGLSPAEFRKRETSSVSSPTGQDMPRRD